MKTTNNNRKSKFLAFLLSVMMVSTAGAMFASCTDGDESSSSSSSSEQTEETKTDKGDIKNANFDFTTLSSKTAIGTSVTGWSRSVNSTSSGSASSSKSASGVLDTSADHWKYLTGSNYTKEQLEAMSDADAVKDWANFSVKDKLAYYDVWKARPANKDKSISKDFEAYESINIDEEDIPTVENPGTRPTEDGEELDSNVLMIHNHYYTSSSTKDKPIGTAQKYTSSSTVTVPAGSSAKFSVWVKTADLQSAASGNSATQDAVGKGAYISVTHSVGGKSLDAYEVKNIDVEDWTQYTFYLKGSYYADTTFSLVLGLGQGSTNDRYEYVNGYAFFDDIQFELIENGDFDKDTAGWKTVDLESEKADKTVDTFKDDATSFAMNFYGDTSAWGTADIPATVVGTATASTDGSKLNPTAVSTDVAKVFENQAAIATEADSNEYLKLVYDNFFKDTDFVESEEVLMFLSTKGTAYTAENAMTFTLPDGQDYMGLSFFVKTSDLNGGTGAGITLVDALNKTAFTALDTSDVKGVKIGDDEDAYDGWQQVFFFIERAEDVAGDLNFNLTFNYGPTDITSSTAKTTFAQGFAAFAKFTQYVGMTELEYETAAVGTYSKKVTLKGAEEDKAAGNSGFDSAVGVPSNALETGLANPQNYKGVYSDNYRVSLPTAETWNDNTKRNYNQYNQAGLLNREKFAEYFDTYDATKPEYAWLNSLKASALAANAENTTAEKVWNYHFGDATQPLMIMNDTQATKSYGFIGTSKSTSDEYTAVSLRVKTVNAKASVYLIDMDDSSRQSVLSVNRALTYWYNDEGNICTGDPSENKTVVAFKLQKNGLYKANKNWEGYEKLGALKDEYFANLSAYTEADGILYAAENSASHDYYDYKWNREMFYKNNDSWYTEANGAGVKVIDLASVTEGVEGVSNGVLTARYLPEAKQELKVENINTNGEWAYVTFYIRKGATTKNYRLEVWSSATRKGDANKSEGGYVVFDSNNPGTASENFALTEDYKENEKVTWFESVFSYFDTDKHVRYNAELDVDKSGNVYEESYTPSAFTESIAYLAYLNYDNDNVYNVFADYSVSDQEVVAQEITDDTTPDSEEEEEEENDGANAWLLASSIAVAAVLVLAVASIVVRKLVAKFQRKHGAKARKTVKEKKAPTKKAKPSVDEDSPYND